MSGFLERHFVFFTVILPVPTTAFTQVPAEWMLPVVLEVSVLPTVLPAERGKHGQPQAGRVAAERQRQVLVLQSGAQPSTRQAYCHALPMTGSNGRRKCKAQAYEEEGREDKAPRDSMSKTRREVPARGRELEGSCGVDVEVGEVGLPLPSPGASVLLAWSLQARTTQQRFIRKQKTLKEHP